MIVKHSRTVFHLAITENTALRVVLYIPKEKLDWYNEHGLHDQVLKELYPVILSYVVATKHGLSAAKKQKEAEANRAIHMDGYRILYKFITRSSQQTLIRTEKSFTFPEQQDDELLADQKPTVHTVYKGLSVYPAQLLVSVDDELFVGTNTLDSYFTTL